MCMKVPNLGKAAAICFEDKPEKLTSFEAVAGLLKVEIIQI